MRIDVAPLGEHPRPAPPPGARRRAHAAPPAVSLSRPRLWPRGREPGTSTWPLVLPPFLVARSVSLLVSVLAVWQQSPSPGFPTGDALRAAFDRWDSQSYVAIAEHGYPSVLDFGLGRPGHLVAFFPGYPLLIRAVMTVTGDAVVAGLLVSTVMELVTLHLVARLVLDERDRTAARFAVWALALWPFAAFLGAVYAESTVIAAAAGALLLARRGRHAAACLVAALACAVRVTGVALIPALLVEHLVRRRGRPSAGILWLLAVPVPLLLFGAYTRLHTGDWLAWLHAEGSASFAYRHLDWPWAGARATWSSAVSSSLPASATYIFSLELVFGVGGGLVCAALWLSRRLAASLATYCTAVWLLAVCAPYWVSVPRYLIAMFPALIPAGDLLARRPEWRAAAVAASAGLFAYGAGVYASGRWLG
jgi:Mannosyltransferase (PIG-V)